MLTRSSENSLVLHTHTHTPIEWKPYFYFTLRRGMKGKMKERLKRAIKIVKRKEGNDKI